MTLRVDATSGPVETAITLAGALVVTLFGPAIVAGRARYSGRALEEGRQ